MGRFSRYEFVQKIAVGGMAEVWSAWAVSPDGSTTDVVVKRILPQFAGDEKFQSMLLEEAEVTARLQHPNIVQVFDWGTLDDTCFLAMERVVGLDGRQLIDACGMRGIRITPEIALFAMGEIFKGLDVAHRATDSKGRALGIVHRDVSPSNVLVSLSGDVKLADFGIAKAKSRASHTVAGQVRGKPRYMSPEQAMGQELDGRSDLFTAGIVLHEMLTGKPVFPPSTYLDEVVEVIKKGVPAPSKVNPDVPAEIDSLVLALCERDLAKRVKTGGAAYQLIVEWAVKHKRKLGPQPVAELVTSIVRPTQEKKASTAPKTATRIMRMEDVAGMPRFSTQGKLLDPDLAADAMSAPTPRLSPSGQRRMPERPKREDRDTADPDAPASTQLMEMPMSADAVPPEQDGPTDRRLARPAPTVIGAVPPADAMDDVATERPPTHSTERRPPKSGGNTAGIAAAAAIVAVAIAVAAWWAIPRGAETPETGATATPDLALDFEAAAAAVAANATAEPTPDLTSVPGTPTPGRTRAPIAATTAPIAAGSATKRPKASPTPTATATVEAAAPVATGPGWLTLRSKPAGEVTIDGQWAGTTPLTKHELMNGVHTVVVNSEDGRSATSQVTIVAGQTTPVTLTLQ